MLVRTSDIACEGVICGEEHLAEDDQATVDLDILDLGFLGGALLETCSRRYGEHMALARLHGGPLDGQILPLDDTNRDSMIVPYGATQVIYRRGSDAINTGHGDGPTEVGFWFAESSDDISPNDD